MLCVAVPSQRSFDVCIQRNLFRGSVLSHFELDSAGVAQVRTPVAWRLTNATLTAARQVSGASAAPIQSGLIAAREAGE